MITNAVIRTQAPRRSPASRQLALARIPGSGANSVIELAGDDAWGHRLGEGVAAGRSGSGVAAAEVLKITIWRLAA
jgi:hypothetical protein